MLRVSALENLCSRTIFCSNTFRLMSGILLSTSFSLRMTVCLIQGSREEESWQVILAASFWGALGRAWLALAGGARADYGCVSTVFLGSCHSLQRAIIDLPREILCDFVRGVAMQIFLWQLLWRGSKVFLCRGVSQWFLLVALDPTYMRPLNVFQF